MNNTRYPLSMRVSFVLLSVILFLFAIIKAKDFLYPIAFGILLAYLLYPIANFLEKKGLPRILSILISLIIFVGVLSFAGKFLLGRLNSLLGDFPTLKKQSLANIEVILASLEDWFGLSDHTIEMKLKEMALGLFEYGGAFMGNILNATAGVAFKIAILPVFIFLFLYYRTKFAYFLLQVVPKAKKKATIGLMRDLSTVASRYMGGVFIVVLILCVLNSLGLIIIGVDYPILLGVVAAVFNFIPYFGTWMGGLFPILYALLAMDSPTYAFKVFLMFVIIQFVENNILTPNIVGGNVKINPLIIIIGLIAGGMVWGIPGMLVAVPFLAMARIIFQNFEGMQPFAYLLGITGTRKHAITKENIQKFIDRFKK